MNVCASAIPFSNGLILSVGRQPSDFPSLSLTLMNNLRRYFIHDFPAASIHELEKGSARAPSLSLPARRPIKLHEYYR